MRASSFPVLMYHRVVRGYQSDSGKLAVDERLFREQMAALQQRGLVCSALCDVLGLVDASQDVSHHVAVTFDDAFADFGEHAWPIISALGYRATLYVPTAHVGETASWLPGDGARLPLLSWQAIQDLRADGVEIGSHGHVHHPLDEEAPGIVTSELELSRRVLQERTGSEALTLAYPNGYASSTTRRIARDAGFASACVIGHSRQGARADRLAIRRLHVRGAHRPQDLLRLIEGQHSTLEGFAKRSAEKPWRAARRARHTVRVKAGSDG